MVTLRRAIVVPPVDSGLVQACGVIAQDGKYCEHSVTWRGNRAMMTPPETSGKPGQKLAGRHLFAGQLWSHFGHFIAESMSRFWALDHMTKPPDSIIFIPKRPGKSHNIRGYQKEFFELLGINIPINVIEEPTEIEELIIPGQGFGLGQISKGSEYFITYFANNFAKDIKPKGAKKIYLSRTNLGGREGGAVLEEVIEKNLTSQGYSIYHPQENSITDQVAQYRAVEKIIGLDGSAFHLFGFVGKPSQKVAIILRRNSNVFNGLRNQIENFCAITPTLANVVVADWIPKHKTRPGRYSFGQLDFPALCEILQNAGFVGDCNDWISPRFREMKQGMLSIAKEKGLEYVRLRKPENKSAQSEKQN